MQKLDLAKRHKKYYSAARAPEVIGIEPAEFLTITRKVGPSGRAFLERIQRLLAVALRHGHDSLVLGAWGCGVFRNDQTCVAQWFRVHLTNSSQFRNSFGASTSYLCT